MPLTQYSYCCLSLYLQKCLQPVRRCIKVAAKLYFFGLYNALMVSANKLLFDEVCPFIQPFYTVHLVDIPVHVHYCRYYVLCIKLITFCMLLIFHYLYILLYPTWFFFTTNTLNELNCNSTAVALHYLIQTHPSLHTYINTTIFNYIV